MSWLDDLPGPEGAYPNKGQATMRTQRFDPDGPHSPDLTREAGDQLGELVKFLNYATMGRAPGLDYPSDAYMLLGNWAHAAGMMPQLAAQAAAFLEAQGDRAGLYDARGHDPNDQLYLGQSALERAATAAWALCRALQDAQNAIAGVGVREDGPDDL